MKKFKFAIIISRRTWYDVRLVGVLFLLLIILDIPIRYLAGTIVILIGNLFGFELITWT